MAFLDEAQTLANEVELSIAQLAEQALGQWFTESFKSFASAQTAFNAHIINQVNANTSAISSQATSSSSAPTSSSYGPVSSSGSSGS